MNRLKTNKKIDKVRVDDQEEDKGIRHNKRKREIRKEMKKNAKRLQRTFLPTK